MPKPASCLAAHTSAPGFHAQPRHPAPLWTSAPHPCPPRNTFLLPPSVSKPLSLLSVRMLSSVNSPEAQSASDPPSVSTRLQSLVRGAHRALCSQLPSSDGSSSLESESLRGWFIRRCLFLDVSLITTAEQIDARWIPVKEMMPCFISHSFTHFHIA